MSEHFGVNSNGVFFGRVFVNRKIIAIKEIEEEKIQASNKAKEDAKSKIIKEKNDTKKFDKEENLKKAKQADKDKKTVKLDDFDFQNEFSNSIEETF